MNTETLVSLLLRIGIAFSFLYAAVQSFLNPTAWIGFFPIWVQDVAAATIGLETMLTMFSVGEIVVAVWVFSGWKGLHSGLVAAAMVGGIVVFNLGALDILFRDVSLVAMCIAYAVFSYRRN
jgi:hypothetical protein